MLLFSFLLVGALSGCGQSGSTTAPVTPTDTTTPTAQPLTKYQFSAKVDRKSGTPPFPINTGDTITGTFTFDPAVKDTFLLSTQGGYVQKLPASVQVHIGSTTINADLTNWLGYTIRTNCDDTNDATSSDTFSWYVNDTVLASMYGLDYIQTSFILGDTTGKVFTSDIMPNSLNVNDFDMRNLFISGTKIIADTPNILWNLRAQITSVDRVQ
jgi:hypothetical protein